MSCCEGFDQEIEELKAQLKEANEVIAFYASEESWRKEFGSATEVNANRIKNFDVYLNHEYTPIGGKKAKQYEKKNLTPK